MTTQTRSRIALLWLSGLPPLGLENAKLTAQKRRRVALLWLPGLPPGLASPLGACNQALGGHCAACVGCPACEAKLSSNAPGLASRLGACNNAIGGNCVVCVGCTACEAKLFSNAPGLASPTVAATVAQVPGDLCTCTSYFVFFICAVGPARPLGNLTKIDNANT